MEQTETRPDDMTVTPPTLREIPVGAIVFDAGGVPALRIPEGYLVGQDDIATPEELAWQFAWPIVFADPVNGAGADTEIEIRKQFVLRSPAEGVVKTKLWSQLCQHRAAAMVEAAPRLVRRETVMRAAKRMTDPAEIRELITRYTPRLPAPEIPPPAWATGAEDWEWDPDEARYTRFVKREWLFPKGGGLVVNANQEAGVDGVARTVTRSFYLNFEETDNDTPEEAMQVSAWFAEAAKVLAQIHLDTDPTDDAKEVAA